MSDDVERVRDALIRATSAHYQPLDALDTLAPRVLAAIRAAAQTAYGCGMMHMPDEGVLDAALAALTDHPGGTKCTTSE